MNLHDWIDELCDVLDIEAEVDEASSLDLRDDGPEIVESAAAPVTDYLLGVAAASTTPPGHGRAAGRRARRLLAEGWDRPADARTRRHRRPDPRRRVVDHSADVFEDARSMRRR